MTALTSAGQLKQLTRMIGDVADCDAVQNALGALDKEAGERLKGHPDFISNVQCSVLESIRRFSAKAPNYELARSILGEDFISPQEIVAARGVIYTNAQHAMFGETLPSQEQLEWCRDNGMMLVAGPPKAMSLLDIRALDTKYFYSKGSDAWYENAKEAFARNDKAETVWIAIRKEPIAGSFGKNWSEQNVLLVAPMTVPNVAEVVWGITVYKAVRGKYLLGNCYVRTSSRVSDGVHVGVGLFVSGGLFVFCWVDDFRDDGIGVSGSRKF